MCRPLQQPTASLRAVEWRVAPLDLRLWRRVGAGATRLPVRRRHRRQGKVPRDRDQAPHCAHAGWGAGAVPTAARTRRALRRPVRAETDGLPRRLEWRLGSRARDAAITPPLRPSPSGHGAMPIPPWCRGAHCERCPCCLRVSVLCVSGSLSCVLCIRCVVVVWRNGERTWVNKPVRIVRWFHPLTEAAATAATRSRLDAEKRVRAARLPRACCWAGRQEGHHTVAVQKSQAKLQEVGSRQPMHCKLSVHG